jgi:hypothetical protein
LSSFLNENKFILVVVAVLVVVAGYYILTRQQSGGSLDLDGTENGGPTPRLDELARAVVSGGPPKDGIPPIDSPSYVTVSEAEDFLQGDEVVFVDESQEPAKIYAQKILVWHEIVNEERGDKTVSITYCPLTGSVVGIFGTVEGSETSFGTSGKLLNSNLVMYDRATSSYWPQIFGAAITGFRKGLILDEFPVLWTRWEMARIQFPDALVLSMETGFLRAYGSDPYGSYQEEGTYYDSGEPFFPLTDRDDTLPAKEVVIGIRRGSTALALLKETLVEEGVANLSFDGKPIVALYDSSLDAVRVFSRTIGSRTLSFEIREGEFFDIETGSAWSALGISVSGELAGSHLERVSSFDVMWFAWYAFFPETDRYG